MHLFLIYFLNLFVYLSFTFPCFWDPPDRSCEHCWSLKCTTPCATYRPLTQGLKGICQTSHKSDVLDAPRKILVTSTALSRKNSAGLRLCSVTTCSNNFSNSVLACEIRKKFGVIKIAPLPRYFPQRHPVTT